jgi:hypothetical protein
VPPGDDERRARDCLDELPPRRAVGEDLLDRVVARARKGPSWARVFERLGVPDPYDADAKDHPVGLGPVGVKLADRRRPAPHAKLPKHHEASEAPRPKQPEGRPQAVKLAEAPKPPPPPTSRPENVPLPALQNPALNPGDPADEEPVLPQRPREVPLLRGPNVQRKKTKSGRVRLAPRAKASGPRVKELAKPAEVVGAESVEAAAAEEPVVQRAPPGPDLGLDDLFGFSGGGRMKRKKDGDDTG